MAMVDCKGNVAMNFQATRIILVSPEYNLIYLFTYMVYLLVGESVLDADMIDATIQTEP